MIWRLTFLLVGSIIGVDINEDVVEYANRRLIANAEFRQSDLRTFRDPHLYVDGIWSSFTAAYFPALPDTLATWIEHLRPGGWLALTEIDDLFGHHPLSNRTPELLARYAEDAIGHSRYDFQMGRKMHAVVEQAGLQVVRQFTVPDAELNFSGRANPDVREAWELRFKQMHLLQNFCGAEFHAVRDDFLNCLDRDDHYCSATVQCCIAIKTDPMPNEGRRTMPCTGAAMSGGIEMDNLSSPPGYGGRSSIRFR